MSRRELHSPAIIREPALRTVTEPVPPLPRTLTRRELREGQSHHRAVPGPAVRVPVDRVPVDRVPVDRVPPVPLVVPGHTLPELAVPDLGAGLQSRRDLKQEPRRRLGRPVLAGALAVGLGASAVAYTTIGNLGNADAAFVVGDSVAAQTAELARTATVDMTYRAAASVSRNERRTAIVATGLRTAQELEAKQKRDAARQAELERLAEERAQIERMRQQAIANAKQNPQAAARVLMADHGWTSDAQYNCLVNLWNGESGWRWWAGNPSSGAYGIPQSLPASKMASFGADYRTNPLTQIRWGLWYIEQTYGNPCNAWSTWLSRSPHWY